ATGGSLCGAASAAGSADGAASRRGADTAAAAGAARGAAASDVAGRAVGAGAVDRAGGASAAVAAGAVDGASGAAVGSSRMNSRVIMSVWVSIFDRAAEPVGRRGDGGGLFAGDRSNSRMSSTCLGEMAGGVT